jgi:hypothetical protein
MAINFFNNLQVNKGYIEIDDGGTANQRGIISYGVNGKLGSTTGWTPDAGSNPGLWIEGSNDGESGGIFMNGNTCALWSPGDQGILKIYDEDNFTQGPVYQITGTGISEGQRFASISNNSYYLDPDGNSQLNTVDVDDYVRHRGDTNTYIGFPSDDTFAVTTFSSERMRITSSGNVGIGTTSPSDKLHVVGTSNFQGAVQVSNSTFVDSARRNIYLNSFAAGGGNGIFFRDSFTYNASITAENHNSSSADGICISGYDGVSFSTGANTRNEKMRITSDSNPTLRLGVSGTGTSIFEMKSASGGSSLIDVEQFLQIKTSGSERLRIGSAGQIGVGGANYGTSGQVLTSNRS